MMCVLTCTKLHTASGIHPPAGYSKQ